MDREILFRGKSLEFRNEGEWVEGGLIEARHVEVEESEICCAIIPKDDSYCGYQEIFLDCWFDVDEDTVGQYVGVKDKNGKKIFTGDIVKDIANGIYKIVYDTKYMRFAFEQNNIKWGLEGFESIKDFEIIGNAWDNPELLGGKNDK